MAGSPQNIIRGLVAADPVVTLVRRTTLALLFLGAYVLLDWVSYLHPVPLGVTPWNPPAGLSIAFLIWFGMRALPLVAAAPVVAEIVVRGWPERPAAILVAAVLLALVYWSAAALLMRRLKLDRELSTARDVAWLVAVIVPATLLAAVAHVLPFALLGDPPAGDGWPRMARYWIGDLNGALVVAPLMLTWGSRGARAWRGPWTRAVLLEVAAQLALLVLTLWVIFGVPYTDEFKFFYLLFLPIVWIALRHGLHGATVAVALTQAGLILAIQSLGYETTTFMEFQVLMLALAGTALLLGAVVSERRRAREELLAQQAALNRALQFAVAGEMTAALAHEVNNPIGALTTYLHAMSMLLQRAPSPDTRVGETLDKALKESRRAGEVIRSLRNLYGSERPRTAAVDAGQLCAAVAEQLGPVSRRQGVALGVTVPRPAPRVLGDPSQIFIVLRNLADNAILAARRGTAARPEVNLRVQVLGDTVRLLVEDTGPGIELSSRELSFAPLSSTNPDGMGLGLAIAKRIVDAHGGSLWAERRTEGGTRFVVELRSPGAVQDGAETLENLA